MKRLIILISLAACYLILTTNARAATITVCLQGGCDFSSVGGIQEAVEKAANGDTILIQPGTYTSIVPIVVNPDYKFKNCLIDTKGKKITIRGEGEVVLNNGNGGLDDPTQISTGICVLGGEVTIDSITIRQTLRPAIYLQSARAIIKNVTYLDIDSVSVDMHQSQAIFINNLFAGGGGISVSDTSYARVENNTFYGGGISFNLCNNNEPSGDVSNNIITRGNIVTSCPEQTQKLANIKVANNFVYRGSSTGDMNCASPGNTAGEECAAGEICTGTTFGWPGFIGADENGTVCVWGEGFIQGGFNTFNTKADSPATLGKAGISTGPCSNGASTACDAYVKSKLLPEPPAPPAPPPPPPGQPLPPGQQPPNPPGRIVFEDNVLPQFMPIIKTIKLPIADLINNKADKKDVFMNIFMYVLFSSVFIMFYHLAINIQNFNIFLMIAYFVLGGFVGLWFNSWEMGMAISMVLSLLFI